MLSSDEILAFENTDNVYLRDAIEYFRRKDATLNSLVSEIKLGFSQDKAMIVNNKSDSEEKDKQIPFFTKIYNLKVLIINNLKI